MSKPFENIQLSHLSLLSTLVVYKINKRKTEIIFVQLGWHFSIQFSINLRAIMRKHWVKRENIYEKPFYKQKLKMTLLTVFVMAIVFFAYQLFYIKQLQIEIERKASNVYNYEKIVDERRIIR